MTEHNRYVDYHTSLRKKVFKLLDENPLFTPKQLAKQLEMTLKEYKSHRQTLTNYRSQWKYTHQKQRGSIRSCPDEVHNAFYRGVLSVGVVGGVRGELVEVLKRTGNGWCFGLPVPRVGRGWTFTRAKNKYFLYKSGLGRIRLFDNGTVELFVRKPASDGRCMQLFCDAFIKTYLITDLRVLEGFQKSLMRRFHATFDFGQRLPYRKITAFKQTHNFTMVTGDRTHPTCAEFMMDYQTEVFQARSLFEQLGEMLSAFGNLNKPNGLQGKPLERDYSR